MVAAVSLPQVVSSEQRLVVHGVAWKEYVLLREALDIPGLRMTYLKGALELMSPSRSHERNKKTIARLVETFAVLTRLPLIGYGSTTFRRVAKERGVEPDECWCVGHQMRDGEFPDIVLEVIETAPLLDKLTVYDGLDVPEVWLFENAAFALYQRKKNGGYTRIARSRLLPTLDLKLIARLAQRDDQDVALQELVELVGAKKTKPSRKSRRR